MLISSMNLRLHNDRQDHRISLGPFPQILSKGILDLGFDLAPVRDIASGLLLLRIADPDYETPVAVEGGLMNVFSCLTFLPVTLSMPFAPLPGYPIVWVFAAVIIATPIAMYLLKFIRKPAF